MLRVRHLTLRYSNGKCALADFSLEVKAGELAIVVRGTAAARRRCCISRTLAPTSGAVWLNDVDLTHLTGEKLRCARLELAMISQHASLVRRRSVLANVAAGSLGRHYTFRTALGGLPQTNCLRPTAIFTRSVLSSWRSNEPGRCRADRPSAWRLPAR